VRVQRGRDLRQLTGYGRIAPSNVMLGKRSHSPPVQARGSRLASVHAIRTDLDARDYSDLLTIKVMR
jgi:hypothetical protein